MGRSLLNILLRGRGRRFALVFRRRKGGGRYDECLTEWAVGSSSRQFVGRNIVVTMLSLINYYTFRFYRMRQRQSTVGSGQFVGRGGVVTMLGLISDGRMSNEL